MPFNASNFGAANNTGDDLALFSRIFGSEVITAHDRSTQFSDKHTVQKMSSGTSYQFPLSGRLGPANKYLARGESVVGAAIPFGKETVTIDGQLYEAAWLTRQDEAFTHFNARQVHSKQLGESLAQYKDLTVASCGILAARASNKITGLPGGGSVVNANAKIDGNELYNALYAGRQTLDEKDVNEEAFAFLRPLEYHLLLQSDKLVNRDFLSGANGGVDTGIVSIIAGMNIIKTNNLPSTNITGSIGGKYDVDASNIAALIMTRDAVATAELMGITTEVAWQIKEQAYLAVSTMMTGHGVLRPECAVEVVTA